MTPRVKICCITSVEEARIAIRHGVDAIGLVSDIPSGPEVLDEDLITAIASAVRAEVTTFVLTSRREPESIIELVRRCGTHGVQLVARVEPAVHDHLRHELAEVLLVQVVHVGTTDAEQVALDVAPHVDFLMLDTGGRGLPAQVLGGTGRVHDWSISRRIRERLSVPVFLAGGLRPENVERAIETVRPDGIDVCNGVRANGQLDEDKLAALMERVRGFRS